MTLAGRRWTLVMAICTAGAVGMADEITTATSAAMTLWPDGAPGALGSREVDIPTLTPWRAPAEKATGAAMVICPGGGYQGLAPHEGSDYARWLNELGISAFVLKYRLGSAGYHHPVMLNDAARAMRMVRANSAEWGIDPDRVGIIGSSAGGHLASTMITHFDGGDAGSTDTIERQSSRPDLGILVYPVISMGQHTHKGSKKNLLGENPSEELVMLLSNETQVTSGTPPTFIFHTADDSVVKVENALLFAAALSGVDVPYELHVYPRGAHGMGLGTKEWNPAGRHAWTRACEAWLKAQGWVAK